jgi:thymidylate synthase (FAD)
MAAPSNSIDVLDHGFVRLDAVMADDLSVVNAARVSFGARVDTMDDRNAGLVRFLMRERHGTPFEHNFFRFHIKAPLFVTREWQRHRVGSFNERSGRYSELPDEFYVPAGPDVRTQVGKPGAYTFEPVDDDTAARARHEIEENATRAFAAYERMLEQGVAKEVARAVLPLSTYTKYYWSCNPRSLMHFCSLRNHEAAQFEIRRYAAAAESFLERTMPITHAAFVANDRRSP